VAPAASTPSKRALDVDEVGAVDLLARQRLPRRLPQHIGRDGGAGADTEREAKFVRVLRDHAAAGHEFTAAACAEATGWSLATVKTYLAKKVRRAGLIDDVGGGRFRATVPPGLDDAGFRRLMSQNADDGGVDTVDAWLAALDRHIDVAAARGWVVPKDRVDAIVARLRDLAGAAAPTPPVVDDVLLAWLSSLPWATRATVRALFFVGDAHQRVYAQPTTMGKCGIDIRGRSKKLRLNFRTTAEIRRWATAGRRARRRPVAAAWHDARQRSLLFVAATRARETLTVVGWGTRTYP
jgi:hypothetical protein